MYIFNKIKQLFTKNPDIKINKSFITSYQSPYANIEIKGNYND